MNNKKSYIQLNTFDDLWNMLFDTWIKYSNRSNSKDVLWLIISDLIFIIISSWLF